MNNIKNLISIEDLNKEDIIEIIEKSIAIEKGHKLFLGNHSFIENKIIGLLFFEPSTRTRFSFETSIYKSQGKILSFDEKKSSTIKGESLYDTIMTMEIYCDLLIIRHPDNNIFNEIKKYTSKPIINAGNGNDEHPTQALIDITTMIKHEKNYYNIIDNGNNSKRNILFVGDINNNRSVNSLIKCLHKVFNNVNIYVYSIQEDFNQNLKKYIKNNNIKITRVFSYDECISDMDYVYITRSQKERQANIIDYKEEMIMTPHIMNKMKPTCGLMHPFPRNEEIDIRCDGNPRSIYFEQIKNGLFVRKIIMEQLLNNYDNNFNKINKVISGTTDGGYMFTEI